MDIPVFVYDEIEFTNFEQIKEHEDALINVCYQFDWKDEACNAELDRFSDAVDEYLYKVLEFYVEKEKEGNKYTDELFELKKAIFKFIELQKWLWRKPSDTEIVEYDLEKSYAIKISYFKVPRTDDIYYAIRYTDSPCTSIMEDIDDNEITRVKRVPKMGYEYISE